MEFYKRKEIQLHDNAHHISKALTTRQSVTNSFLRLAGAALINAWVMCVTRPEELLGRNKELLFACLWEFKKIKNFRFSDLTYSSYSRNGLCQALKVCPSQTVVCTVCDVTIWRHIHVSEPNVLAKLVDIMRIFFYTHFPYFINYQHSKLGSISKEK